MAGGDLRELFVAFHEADEVAEVTARFEALRAAVLAETNEGQPVQGLEFFDKLKSVTEPAVPFKLKRVFTLLQEAVDKKKGSAEPAPPQRVLVSGAGPVGLRSAVESALLGDLVIVVEKRAVFSRVNILMFWQQTMDDMVSLGAKVFYPALETHGNPLHMGTREIQLVLLKTALLLGVDVRYETTLEGLRFEDGGWRAVLKDHKRRSLVGVLGFKPNKQGDYEATFKCNMMDAPEVDQGFLAMSGGRVAPMALDALLVAEGEWSQTSRRLGFHKSIDKFSRAIGIVVNLQYDKTDETEKKLRSFALGFSPEQNAVRDEMARRGIVLENVEYLKGKTHYLVGTFFKTNSLVEFGVVKSTGKDVLDKDNVDLKALRVFAREMASSVGIPESAPFTDVNPIQLFDFSTRARALEAVRVVDPVSRTVSEKPCENGLLTFLVGDALLEPFWPQGLGSNRGFHTGLDTVHALQVNKHQGMEMALKERKFSYNIMNIMTWKAGVTLNPHSAWSVDPIDRYSPLVIKMCRNHLFERGRIDEVPERYASIVGATGLYIS